MQPAFAGAFCALAERTPKRLARASIAREYRERGFKRSGGRGARIQGSFGFRLTTALKETDACRRGSHFRQSVVSTRYDLLDNSAARINSTVAWLVQELTST